MDNISAAVCALLADSTARDVVEGMSRRPKELVFGNSLGRLKALGIMALKSKNVPTRARGFISEYFRKRRIAKYRDQLWHKHQREIQQEAKPAKDAVMRHQKAISEFINGMRNDVITVWDVPEAPVRDLTKVLHKDRTKIFVNDPETPGHAWSSDQTSEYARWVVQYAAQLVAYGYGYNFAYVIGVLLGVAYEDYVYNKHETDKSLYTY